MGALIVGQAMTMQNIQGMKYIPDIYEGLSDGAGSLYNYDYPALYNNVAASNFWTGALSGLYNSITNTVVPWYRTARPIKTATEIAKQLAIQSAPITLPLTGAGTVAYTLHSILPWYLSYPILTAGMIAAGTRLPISSHVISEISNGVDLDPQTIPNIANGVLAVGKTIISPQAVKGVVTGVYQANKDGLRTVKDDLLNTIRDEFSNTKDAIKDEIIDNYTALKNEFLQNENGIKNEIKNELNNAKDAIKAETEHNCRTMFNIPADQPVNAETIAKKTIEEPVRKIFNIDPNEAVSADAVMRNIAKNTIYRFGIPTAALIAATPIAITAGYFGCKYAYYRLTTEPEPPIFIESSQKGLWQNLKNFVLRHTDEIPELAYSAELETTFDLITRSSINAFNEIQEGNQKIFYEPILMHGPPGTGKTAKAKQMIKQIYQATNGKMQWRITNGSMLLNAGQKGINKMFEWLNKQPAACLFIDEADTLFPDRDEMEKHPERLEIVNHLLSLIGERSNKFMIIMTTNRLGAFDEAMARRIDNLIHIPLPNEQGRNRVLALYRDSMLLNQKTGAHAITLDESIRRHLTDAKIAEIARKTDGLSNGDLQGIINKIKTYASISADGRATMEIINLAVKEYVDKHNAFKDAHNKKKA